MMRAKPLLLALGLVLVVLGTTSTAATANAEPLPRFRLELESHPNAYGQFPPSLSLTVKNVAVAGYPVEARNVKVAITPLVDPGCRVNPPTLSFADCIVADELSAGEYDPHDGIWSIPSIPSGHSVSGVFRPDSLTLSADSVYDIAEKIPLLVRAVITGVEPNPAAALLPVHPVEEWYLFTRRDSARTSNATLGDAGVEVAIDRTVPAGTREATVNVTATNRPRPVASGPSGVCRGQSSCINTQYDVQIGLD